MSPEREVEDVADEAADEAVDTADAATPFAKWEIIETLKDRFRAKKPRMQRQVLAQYREDGDGGEGDVDRRQFLKLLGFTAGGTVVAGGTGWLMGKKVFSDTSRFTITGMAGGTDTINVSGREVIRIGDGETFENVLIDQTSGGSGVTLSATGTNWTIRNVGLQGQYDIANRFFGGGDTGGGESIIEHVYAGDGVDSSVGSAREPQFGIWVTPEHSGHLSIRGVNVQEAMDNGIYGSAPGSNSNGQRGTIDMLNCYGRNNRISHFRTAGGEIVNCVAINDGQPEGRNIWVWPTRGDADVEVRNCDFDCGSYPHGYDFGREGGTTVARVIDTDYAPADSTRFQGNVQLDEENVGHNPEDRVPEGVPMEAGVASTGEENTGEWPEDGSRSNGGSGNGADPC